MVRKLIEWAVNSPLIVILLALTLLVVGVYSFIKVNVEAYPDPAPAIIEVVAQYPGASAEEVERQVTIPLEVTLAGMPGLKYTRTKSLFGLSHLRNQFEYGVDFYKARQEVINRLQFVSNLPPGVTPQISPETPTGEIYRYTLNSPKDALGRDIYTLNDLKSLQDWTLERQFRRVPRIADITSSGGTVKRFEIHPDPDRLKMYGITLTQLQNAIANSNANVGGDYLTQGPLVLNVRGIGLLGGGQDPMQSKEVLGLETEELKAYLKTANHLPESEKARLSEAFTGGKVKPPLTDSEKSRLNDIRRIVGARSATRAAAYLRAEESRRLREIRQIVVAVVNNVPVTVDQLVDGGPRIKMNAETTLASAGMADDNRNAGFEEDLGDRGVVVGHQTRLGKVSLSRPKRDDEGPEVRADANGWIDADEKIQSIVLLRKGEDSLPALSDVKTKVEELNQPGRLLPGVQIEPYYDRTDLINVTTETVRENLILGMVLVTVILFMFLSNVRSAIIVAINIPLALLFAFSMLFVRGKSANLLSIGAVDFGIIVDSSVIMVENIYRHLCAGESQELPLRDRIIHASHEVERGLFFSTAIMVCAFIPLFTMQGPEGQIFGPMADTYAFALGGALLLALTLSPVLCLLFFRNLKPRDDNFLVRWLKGSYLRQLERCLNHRFLTLAVFGILLGVTLSLLFLPPWVLYTVGIGDGERPLLGREFMPELEEGNFWIRGRFPLNISLDEAAGKSKIARSIMSEFPEVETVVNQVGRPDDGTDPDGYYNSEFFVPLKAENQWPAVQEETGLMAWFRGKRARTKLELTEEMSGRLRTVLPGIDWNFSQNIRDNVMESLSGVKGDNSVKIIGPDLNELERLADEFKTVLNSIQGIEEVGVFRIKGQPNLEFPVDPEKCKFWGVLKTDVQNVIQSAIGGKPLTQMIEGEKLVDVTLRWPARLRTDEQAILKIPVEVPNNTVTPGTTPSLPQTPLTGSAGGFSSTGTGQTMPSLTGSSLFGANLNNINNTPSRHLGDFVTPVSENGKRDPAGHFIHSGASTIYREQGNRLIAIKFSVRNRDLASAVAEAQEKTKDIIQAPYRAEWSGEFQEMEEAERRLMFIIPLSLGLIFCLLYLAFASLWDVFAILSNVVALSMGGIWALLLTGTNFSISAAVGFISIFGVAIMDGLLSVAYFNRLRFQGVPLREAILRGAEKRVRPMMMTALTAVFGLLPAALSTRIGAQTQKPLAIVVVGGMIMTLLLNRYLMPVLYSFYGHREPRGEASSRMAH
jgi:cobalt-zinc-cadmium resistance protein CzcA